MEQTAIEWLVENVIISAPLNWDTTIVEQAKAMEKQQIVNSWDSGYQDGLDEGQWENSRQYLSGKHYYDITYKTYKK
jgi:hypothetical protein